MQMHVRMGGFLMACAVAVASSWAVAADGIVTRPLNFAKGASSTVVKGTLRGDKTIDYRLRAKGGQTMSVALKTDHPSNYFNVLPPGSNDVATFVGSTSGNAWTGALPADGEYTIRVYLMRNAARRNETANYTLTVGVTGSAPAGRDSKVKGTPYHATGRVPCSMGSDSAGASQCDFGVIRGKAGQAEVHVTPPGGFRRVLTFAGDKVTSEGARVKADKSSDLWSVDVNDHEHYRIPEAVITGG